MRIGLITWWKTLNYGAMLQAVATFAYLKSLGHEVEMVDFRQPADRYPDMLKWRDWYGGKQGKVKVLLEYKALATRRRIRKCSDFCLRHLLIGKPCRTYDDIIAQKYDLLIVGSDQLWNPVFLERENDYLFADLDSSFPRISFATSIASNELSDEIQERFKLGLAKFSKISLREPTLIPLLERLSGKNIFWSVDPTLLLTKNQWCQACDVKQNETGPRAPIVAYCLSGFEKYLDDLISLAQEEKRKIHLYIDLHSFRYLEPLSVRGVLRYLKVRLRLMLSRHILVCMASSPADFVQDVAKSYAVVADSFHALMFATIFGKNVKIHVPDSRVCMSSRITGFLEHAGITDVLVQRFSPDCLKRRTVFSRAKLNRWISESQDWLKVAIMEQT